MYLASGRPAGFRPRFLSKSQRNEQMQIKFYEVNLLENGRIKSFFCSQHDALLGTKNLQFLLKLERLNVCARGSRDFPAFFLDFSVFRLYPVLSSIFHSAPGPLLLHHCRQGDLPRRAVAAFGHMLFHCANEQSPRLLSTLGYAPLSFVAEDANFLRICIQLDSASDGFFRRQG